MNCSLNKSEFTVLTYKCLGQAVLSMVQWLSSVSRVQALTFFSSLPSLASWISFLLYAFACKSPDGSYTPRHHAISKPGQRVLRTRKKVISQKLPVNVIVQNQVIISPLATEEDEKVDVSPFTEYSGRQIREIRIRNVLWFKQQHLSSIKSKSRFPQIHTDYVDTQQNLYVHIDGLMDFQFFY